MIVTGDALHCNRRMVDAIVAKGGDYCFTLKANQEPLLSDARAALGKGQAGMSIRRRRPAGTRWDARSASWLRPRASRNTMDLQV